MNLLDIVKYGQLHNPICCPNIYIRTLDGEEARSTLRRWRDRVMKDTRTRTWPHWSNISDQIGPIRVDWREIEYSCFVDVSEWFALNLDKSEVLILGTAVDEEWKVLSMMLHSASILWWCPTASEVLASQSTTHFPFMYTSMKFVKPSHKGVTSQPWKECLRWWSQVDCSLNVSARLDYIMYAILYTTPRFNLFKLQPAQNSVACVIPNSRKRDSITPILAAWHSMAANRCSDSK